MRILNVHSGNLFGGIETFLLQLTKHRALCPKIEFHYALCFQGRLSKELQASGAEVYDLGKIRLRHPQSVWDGRKHLRELLKTRNFQAVALHSAWSKLIFGSVIAKQNIPMIQWFHGARSKNLQEQFSASWKPALAIFNSRFTQSTFRGVFHGIPEEVIYLPYAPSVSDQRDAFKARRLETQTPEDHIVILHVGRMEPGKGQDILLQALSRNLESSNWTCWLAGGAKKKTEFQYQQQLHSLGSQLGVEKQLRFLGERNDVESLLQSADIYCQPNTKPEGFGLSIVEALSAKLPVIATSLGATPEMINESCGILIPPGNVALLTDALSHLVKDQQQRKVLGMNGFHRIQELCAPEIQVPGLQTILLSHLGQGNDTPGHC